MEAADEVPNAKRLVEHAKEWFRLMRQPMPPPSAPPPTYEQVAGACIDAAVRPPAAQDADLASTPMEALDKAGRSGAARAMHTEETVLPSGMSSFLAAQGEQSSASASSSQANRTMSEVNSFLATGLDWILGEQKTCRPSSDDTAGGTELRNTESGGNASASNGGRCTFRVMVPQQYPGVQYRKSKNLDDRYPRYAKSGTVVTGQLENSGEWLRISDSVFLPMTVGGIQILEQCEVVQENKAARSSTGSSLWFACSQGNKDEEDGTLNVLA